MSREPRSYCKYGHLKSGENLLLRERAPASWTTKDGKKKWHAAYTERVCRVCLNRQKREWDAKHGRVNAYHGAVLKQQIAERRASDIDAEVTDLVS